MARKYEVIVIGGGIVGLATALQVLKAAPGLSVAVLEKEDRLARHQTGHNSGVIHRGIYYRPGSLKAKNCAEGVRALLHFCDENEVPYELCGKLIVATSPEELPRLEELYQRGVANGVEGIERVGKARILEIEPHCNGIEGIYSPKTGIIDFVKVAEAYAVQIRKLGGAIHLQEKVRTWTTRPACSVLATDTAEFSGRFVVNCAGLHADRVAQLEDSTVSAGRIIPFRGEYYTLKPERCSLLKGLIYPVPDPSFPFLGVHLTRMISGQVEAGPNAVLAWAREGYSKTSFNVKDAWDILSYQGFWKLSQRYWKMGCYETFRSFSKKAFLKDLQRLVPQLQEEDLIACGSGVRAQIVTPDGRVFDDFALVEKQRAIHVLSAPSPGATASLAIGKHIAAEVLKRFNLPVHNGVIQ